MRDLTRPSGGRDFLTRSEQHHPPLGAKFWGGSRGTFVGDLCMSTAACLPFFSSSTPSVMLALLLQLPPFRVEYSLPSPISVELCVHTLRIGAFSSNYKK